MKSSVLTVVALFVLNLLTAQTIKGVLETPNHQPVSYATVTLHNVSDSVLVKGALSGEDGRFEISNVGAGQYFLKATSIGMETYHSETISFAGSSNLDLAPFMLKEATTTLKEVTIAARRPPVEVKADKTVLNVEGTVNATGLNAIELLRKAPGVTVDNNDNINVKGKSSVKIMIDGRDVPLDGKDLAALLKSTQAVDIANIEIISNPSARFDASGNAGIINIRLRKNKSFGTNGNVGLEGVYGITMKGGGNISLNHRTKKVSVFGNYSNHFGKWHNTNFFDRQQNGLRFDQETSQFDDNARHTVRTGADWFINDKHTIGVLLNGNTNLANWNSESIAKIGNDVSPFNVDSLLVASNDITGRRNNGSVNLNYRFADTSGHTLNLDIDHGLFRIDGRSYQPNFYRSADNTESRSTFIYRNYTPTDIDITTVKGDYEQKLWGGTFGTGFKFSNVATDNTFDFFNVINNTDIKDLGRSNRFVYEEITRAGYVNYNRKFGEKLNIQAGLRLENTDYMGELISETPQDGELVENEYTELFPSAAVTYSFNKKIGANLTYSRRIDRPSYQDLNPFEFKLDELTYQKGNKDLIPQFTHSLELSPTFNGFPIVTFGFSKTNDVFTQILDTIDRNATFITQYNLADQTNASITLNAPVPIAKWWDGFVSITGMYSQFEGDINGRNPFSQSFYAYNLYSEQTIKLPKGFSVQLSGWFNGPAYWGTMKSSSQGAMDLGIQKKIMNDKGELRLRVGDILGTAGWKGENIFSPGLRMTARGTWESQTVTLNFSYRFGSSEVKSARQRKTGLEDEKNRVKS